MARKLKYERAITIKLPKEVNEALGKRVQDKQRFFGRYSEADVIRTALVKHLKVKGYLKKDGKYL